MYIHVHCIFLLYYIEIATYITVHYSSQVSISWNVWYARLCETCRLWKGRIRIELKIMKFGNGEKKRLILTDILRK